jgi:hypothetical protein
MLNMVLIVSRRCNIIYFQQNVQGKKSPMVGGGIPKIRGLRQGGGVVAKSGPAFRECAPTRRGF